MKQRLGFDGFVSSPFNTHPRPVRWLARHAGWLPMMAAAAVLAAGLGITIAAQGHGSGSGTADTTHVGDVFGDLIHIKRDPITGQPILQKREVLLPADVLGWAYCPIPVDPAGFEVPFLPQSCDPDPAYVESLVEVDYFGRLSGGRTQERNLRMHFDEAINGIKSADVVSLDVAGRLLLGSDCVAPDSCASWRAIDSPMENLSIYRRLMKYGHLQTDPAEVDTSMGGDPAAGTVYHPALDAGDWAKFSPQVAELLPRATSSLCFSGGFVAACAAPLALTQMDFILAGSFVAGAADKGGKVTPDLVQYLNRILKITIATPETAATVNTVPALIRDVDGTIAPATPGLPAPADELFVDFSVASYLRSDWFSKTVNVLQASGGGWVPTDVDVMTWLNFINGPMPTTASVLPAFVASTSDALRTVQFIHEYAIPADLWAAPAGTVTTVTSVLVGQSDVNQNVTLTATVTSQSTTAITGTVTFVVRTAASVIVGTPVTAPVVGGTATGTFVLPGGTAPQVLSVTAIFTPSGFFAPSQGIGTLTVGLAATVTLVMPAVAPISATPVAVTLAATVAGTAGQQVDEGSVLFTVRDAAGAVVGTPVPALVTTGAATAPFTVPGGLTAQRLTIIGDYQGTTNFAPSSGTNQLVIGCPPMTILPATLPAAAVGQSYSQTFTSDGVNPTLFTLVGQLPTGLTFTVDTLSGVPTVGGTFPISIDAIDAAGCTGTRSYSLDVQQLWNLVTGSGPGIEGLVRLLKADGSVPTGTTAPTQLTPFPGDTSGVRVAMADLTGDGVPETITAAGPGSGPRIRVFDGATGQLIRDFLAFNNGSGGGAFIATGDVNHDGVPDIVAAQGWETPPLPPAGTVGKLAPMNGTSGLIGAVALQWSAVPDAGYSVCWDTTNDNACSGMWWPNGGGTTRLLTGLAPGTYYWQVRAQTASGMSEADGGTWWSFTISAAPPLPPAGTLGKLSPMNGASGLTTTVDIAWSALTDAGYWVCWDTTNDNACNGAWSPNGGGTSRQLMGLAPGTYYWQVRAQTAGGTVEADGGTWWSFTVGTAPLIRVFSGVDLALLYDFHAGAAFGGSGARVAVGDANGDGYADIYAASGPGVIPVVRVFSGATGALLRELIGFDPDLPGGMFIAAGDVNGDGMRDIVIGAAEGTTTRVRVFDAVTLLELRTFTAFDPGRLGGVRVASADLNGDGTAEIIAAAGPGDEPRVRIFDGKTGTELYSYLVYPIGFTGGVFIGAR